MKFRALLITIILLVGISSLAYGQDTLTVMSYNIYHGEKYYNRGQSNLDEIAKLINRVKPDLVALQEVDSLTQRAASLNQNKTVNQVQKLGRLTGMHSYFGKAMDYDGGGYGEGILSTKPLASHEIILPTPKGGEPRALVMVKYPLKNGDTLTFGGTHLCHQYEGNRVAQVKAINGFFEGERNKIILAGDFNFTPQDNPYKFIEQRWLDAAVVANQVEPTIPFDNPSKRIDYFFLSRHNWKILEMKVLKENSSDHMPLVMRIIVP